MLYVFQCRLYGGLEQPLSWDIKRQVIETLVNPIHLETLVGADGKKTVRVSVTYRFGEAIGLYRTSSSPKLLQEGREGQVHILLGTS